MAGNSTVRIYIQGDSGGLNRAARDAERSLARLHGRASTAFRGMTEVAGGFGIAMGAAGVLGAVQQSVQAYQESEKSGARMSAQLDTLAKNTSLYRQQIDDAIKAQSEFGAFDDEDLQDSFTKLVRATGDVGQALELNNLVMDIARGRGVDLATASDAVAKAAAGNTGALKRMGVQVEKGASAQEALAAAQSKYAGQAKQYGETNAASADRSAIAWENAQEEFGAKAARAFQIGADGARRFADDLDGVVDAAGGLKGLAAGGGAFLAVSKLGPAALTAGQALQTMRREIELTSRIKTGQLDVFNIANQKIDTRATQKNIRQAYRDIGQTISSAQASALAKGERIAAPIGKLGTISGVARRAGSSLVSLAGGPMGIAAVAATGLALGLAHVAQEMTTAGEEARDATEAIKQLASAQLDAEGAAIDVQQAELAVDQAQQRRRSTSRALRSESQQYANAVRDHGRGSKEAAAAQGQYNAALQANKIATLDVIEAQHRLKVAKANQQAADVRLTESTNNFKKQLGGVTEKARELGAQYTLDAIHAGDFHARMRQGSFEAKAYADLIIDAAKKTDGFTAANQATAAEVANVVRQMDHVPTQQEIQWITNTVATNGDVEDLKRQLGLIPPNTPANVTSNADAVTGDVRDLKNELYDLNGNVTTVYIDTVRRNKGPAGGGADAATGAAIAGRFDGADNVPVNVSRGEVILNPTQIAMIGAQRVYGALRATGAPVIMPGGSYAGGGKGTRADRWEKKLQRADDAYSLRFNQLDATLAAAEQTVPRDRNDDGTIDADEQRRAYRDDNVARRKIRALIQARLRQLRHYLRQNPPRAARERIYGEIASLTRDYQNYAELKPDTPDTTSGGEADTADLEARLAQAEARAAAADRNLQLSEAALGTFGGYGRGAGRASPLAGRPVVFQSIFPPTPDQYRQGAAFMADAFARQPFRRTPRIRIGA